MQADRTASGMTTQGHFVCAGGPADGRLVPGDQLVKINNVSADDLTPEQAAEIIRECQDTLTMTVLRTMLGPKSSFITPEKKAKLKCNPVKVHFAEEVEVNGQSQGNSLLFLPNVLKVYLENGQTKAFKFDPNTTVKDIVMTLKEKLSLSQIEYFCLALEQQPGVTKLLLLHNEEKIHQVVQKKEAHDYRCLFRVCFLPKKPQTLLQEDPTAFEYLYLQGVNDVLQERFAVEMKCNTALRLAALHIQERLASCGYSSKTNLKTVTKTWGIENFVSSTLLRNMKEKDLKKAISYHMKKCQSLHDPKQKAMSVDQARINYLEELYELKSYGGKAFSATLMLQDRESSINLLVGARYGVSQVVNRKLSIMTTLTDFNSITRIELQPESDRVSLVKIYVQDITPITLLLETVAAKDMSCLIAGYCRVFNDPNINLFPWTDDSKKHKISAEEGYVSRCGSDSDSSSDTDIINTVTSPRSKSSETQGIKRKDRVKRRKKDVKEKTDKPFEEKNDADTEKKTSENNAELDNNLAEVAQKKGKGSQMDVRGNVRGAEEYPSEASDSCHTDSRVLTSPSCDSLDALEEDDLISYSTHYLSETVPLQLHHYTPRQTEPHLLAPPPAHSHPLIHATTGETGCRKSGDGADPQLLTPPLSPSTSFQNTTDSPYTDENLLCFAELSRLVDFLPSPPEASEEDDEEEEELRKRRERLLKELWDSSLKDQALSPSLSSPVSHAEYVFNFDQSDTRCYYNLCSNITPDSAHSLPQPLSKSHKDTKGDPGADFHLNPIPILQPPPGFADSSSDEEFFDARDQFISPEDPASRALSIGVFGTETKKRGPEEEGKTVGSSSKSHGEKLTHFRKRSRKRRSFMATDYTSTVSFPEPDKGCRKQVSKRHHKNMSVGYLDAQMLIADPEPSEQTQNSSPTVSSFTHSEEEPSQLESKPILSKPCSQESFSKLRTSDKNKETQSRARKQEMEMEPDSMESKSVTDLVKKTSPITVVRCRVDPDGKESADRTGDGKEKLEKEETIHVLENGPFDAHMFLPVVSKNESNEDKMSEALKGYLSNIKGPLVAPEEDMSATCVNANSTNGPEQNSCIQENIFEGSSKSLSPPPAPPSSPSPVTVLHVSQSEEELGCTVTIKSNNSQLETEGSANEDEALAVSSTRTASEEVTDSTTSDNVFDDDEVSISLHSTLSDTKHDWVIAARKSIVAETSKVDSEMSTSVVNTGAHTRLNSYSSDYSCALYSITSKVGAASDVMSPTLHISAKPESKLICENDTFSSDVKDCFTSPSFAKSNNLDVSSNSYSPTHFLFQAWSPSIMGRLSASTFRSKIQKMPFYLSRSLEIVNQAGLVSASQSPVEENTKENESEITISVTNVDNVTETLDFTTESVESDESDTTVTGSDVDAVSEEKEKTEPAVDLPLLLIQTEPEHPRQLLPVGLVTPGPVRESPTSIVGSFQPHLSLHMDTPGPVTTTPQSKMRFTQPGEDVPGIKSSPPSSIPPPVVVTTQTLNGPGMSFQPQRTSNDKLLMGLCRPTEPLSSPENITAGCRVFTVCGEPSQTETTVEVVPSLMSESGCTSVLASGCESVVEQIQVPLDACGCPSVYTTCFREGDTFDEELTVYEFSCRTQSSDVTQMTSTGLPLITTSPVHSFLTTLSSYNPSFPRSVLSSSASELSPLLSPLSDGSDYYLSQTHKEIVKRLSKPHYPDPPTGFQVLRGDVDQLLAILESSNFDQTVENQRGRHPRDTCPKHFTENKRVLQIEARHLMAGCHRVVGIGQGPEEMLLALADSFHTLVGLASLCLWFSSCDRCERRNAEAISGLTDVARSFRDFCVAAERASSKRSCQDLSTKLLAKQCTALTASVFCLTQLFRTLTAL